ncbi:NAD-dependent protein deacylase [Allobaculum stercoricanis]|uniref:NAD-dependent protein deacylase n=1 Tax=Allobaculum stercoricanis TaxID=174709 RepID=UPI000379EAA0|nr:NAD-dependent protein deacylase [Allobaculum stercoricanis]
MTLTDILKESNNIVFFGGAGVSTESNIPDFRSPTGLYGEKKEHTYPYPAETMLSRTFFDRYPKQFYEFYFNEMIYLKALPNDAHKALVELENMGKLKAIITQNIDGLHQKAGSKTVYELHGSVLRNYCQKCGTFYDLDQTIANRDEDGIPRCPKDGAVIKPDVVLYEEGLDNDILWNAVEAIAQADCLIVGGTSLVVYPAAGLIDYFRGRHLVLINRDETTKDHMANLVIHDSIGKVLKEAVDQIKE